MLLADLLLEYTTSKTQFDQILNDSSLRMGFECEVITAFSKNDGSDGPGEGPDYDVMDWNELQNAVYISDRLRSRINQDRDEWLTAARRAEWGREGDRFVADWCRTHGGLNPADQKNRNTAFHEWLAQTHERFQKTHDMDEYIQQHYGSMTDFMEEVGIEPNDDFDDQEETTIEEVCQYVAARLQSDLHVDFDEGELSDWQVVEDTSVNDSDLFGVEIISGVYSINEGLQKMQQLFEWFANNNYQTNKTTGLHVSFSIDGLTSSSDYDFLKMMLLFDENYTADLFNRMDNRFANQMRSVLFNELNGEDPIRMMSAGDLERVTATLKNIGKNLASDLGDRKYFSFRHRAHGVVEFRGMGGLHYEQKFDVIRKRVINMAYMMKVGSDDKLMQREYVKRIYQLLTSHRFGIDSIHREPPPENVPGDLSSFLWLARNQPRIGQAIKIGIPSEIVLNIVSLHDILSVAQKRQLRIYVVKHRLHSGSMRAHLRDDPRYNWLASLMRWPLVVPGHHSPDQHTLPFAMHGSDYSGTRPPDDNDDQYDRHLSHQETLPLVRGDR